MNVEKARDHMRKIMQACEGGTNYASVMKRHADEALRALDGDGAEEWEADGSDVRHATTGLTIADCRDCDTARRIAKLPALERAAKAIVDEHADEPDLINIVQQMRELRTRLREIREQVDALAKAEPTEEGE